jgi:glycosyltransferase involved in cell wall biosynthesis
MKVAIVVPHIFMHREILPKVIFSPGTLAIDLAEGLAEEGVDVTLATPGPVITTVQNLTADLTAFEAELAGRGDTYVELLKKHPLTFITLARQVQAELIADVYARANKGEFDIVHIYTNEEDIALPFAKLCKKPVVFTHHDPFNFLVKYKAVFPKYKKLSWLSISKSQRKGMPESTNWVGNIYHGLKPEVFQPIAKPKNDYIAYLGRIIEPKGIHLAIQAIKQYNRENLGKPLKLKIAGKHYSGKKDQYWQEQILPFINNKDIEYVGFIKNIQEKQDFLGNARTLIIPSLFEEPFGMVMIESLACGTPIIGLDSGAIPEVIKHNRTGILVPKAEEPEMVHNLATAIKDIEVIDRNQCRTDFEARFTLKRMSKDHLAVYKKLTGQPMAP